MMPMGERPLPNYQVQRPVAGRSARGHVEADWSTTVIARGRALYASPVRCNAELGDDFKFKGSNLVLPRSRLLPYLTRSSSNEGCTSSSGSTMMPPLF
jgi:hypothetical protein